MFYECLGDVFGEEVFVVVVFLCIGDVVGEAYFDDYGRATCLG